MASEALAGHIELMVDGGMAIPEPTDLDTIMTDPENRTGVPVLAHRAEKWIRFSAQNDALTEEESIGWIPKVQIHF